MWFLAAGALLGAYSSITGGMAASKARREAARQQEEAARYSRAVAAFESRRQREADAGTLAAYRTATAKAGLAFEGSVLTVYGEHVRRAEENARAIVLEGELRARGLQAQARLARMEASAAERAGALEAGASLLSAYGSYTGAKR